MTRQSNDGTGTEFSHWLRIQPELASSSGPIGTNLDFIWSNYKTGKWILMEEKRYMSPLSNVQKSMFGSLHRAIFDNDYMGFWLVKFENTSPCDGFIRVCKTACDSCGAIEVLQTYELSVCELMKFLRLEWFDISEIISEQHGTTSNRAFQS